MHKRPQFATLLVLIRVQNLSTKGNPLPFRELCTRWSHLRMDGTISKVDWNLSKKIIRPMLSLDCKIEAADIRLLVPRCVPIPLQDTVSALATSSWKVIRYSHIEVTYSIC